MEKGGQKGLEHYLKSFLEKESLFKNKKVFQPNFIPIDLLHRDEQQQQIASILAPALKGQKPSNLFIYGKTGTGKTLTMKYVAHKLSELADQRGIPLRIIYINCKLKKVADTEYRLIAHLSKEFGRELPSTGLPTDEVYSIFYDVIEKTPQIIIIVLDEIDQLISKTGDGILYNLTRINAELHNTQISIVGISNDIRLIENIDQRVKSSLSEEELIFSPYNALQIQAILYQRVNDAFNEGVIEQGVVEKCAALAAREHGDARKALELLRVAAELSERNNKETVSLEQLDQAEGKIERDRILDTLVSQPQQCQAVMYAILKMNESKKDNLFTGEVYDAYKSICDQTGLRPLTQRRVSDIIAELDLLGIIHAKVISKGRYGRTREIHVSFTQIENAKKILEEGLNLR